MEASNGKKADVARYTSPILRQSSGTCRMSFWYHMNGRDVGKFGVFLKVCNKGYKVVSHLSLGPVSSVCLCLLQVGTRRYPVYLNDRSQGNAWKKSIIDIGRISTEFQVEFEATRSFSYSGDIAIDDVSFSNCDLPDPQSTCPKSKFRCGKDLRLKVVERRRDLYPYIGYDSYAIAGNGVCIDTDRTCDFVDDCGDNSDEVKSVCNGRVKCNFESGLCGWQQGKSDDFNWKRFKGLTKTAYSGPMRDHTTGTTHS